MSVKALERRKWHLFLPSLVAWQFRWRWTEAQLVDSVAKRGWRLVVFITVRQIPYENMFSENSRNIWKIKICFHNGGRILEIPHWTSILLCKSYYSTNIKFGLCQLLLWRMNRTLSHTRLWLSRKNCLYDITNPEMKSFLGFEPIMRYRNMNQLSIGLLRQWMVNTHCSFEPNALTVFLNSIYRY